jgi:hypothetical protein
VGTLSAQRVEWLGGSNLPGFSTTNFEAPIRQQASPYRVTGFDPLGVRIDPMSPNLSQRYKNCSSVQAGLAITDGR